MQRRTAGGSFDDGTAQASGSPILDVGCDNYLMSDNDTHADTHKGNPSTSHDCKQSTSEVADQTGDPESSNPHAHYEPNFDLKAASWDDPENIARAQRVADAIVSAVHPTRTTRVFEYGAGTGLVTQALGSRVGSATLADTSAGMRAVMKDKVADGRLTNASIIDLDLEADSIELPAQRFDLVLTVLTMHHVTKLDRVLKRFADLLVPGGMLCVVDLDAEDGSFHGHGFHGHHGFEREVLADQIGAAGFSRTTITDCGAIKRDDGEFSMFLAIAKREE